METRSIRIVLTAILLAAALVAPVMPVAAAEVTSKVSVHFAPKPAGDPDGIDTHIVNFFGKATKTLHGAFFEIREQKFVDALVAAAKRGVEVKILTDNASYFFKNEDGTLAARKLNLFIQQLVDAGVQVKRDQNRAALMHNKFCIIDGRYVWSGSVNLTDTYATNCNNGVEMESPEMAVIYEREFDKKFKKQLFGKRAPSYADQQKAKVDGIPMETWFAPEDDPMSRILVLLNGAKKSVHFMQFAFTDEGVTTILLTKFKAGVEVGGIFDRRLYRSTGPYGDFSTLTQAGVPVQLYAGKGLFHHKVFIIDAGTPHAVVITGSQNASSNGNNNNDENVLIMHDQRIGDLYMAEYDRVHTESSEVECQAVYDQDPLAGSIIPEARLMFSSNGVKVKRVKIEYPARWPLEADARSRITIWRRGRNVGSSVGQEFYGKGFYLNTPEMTPTGPNSILEVHFTNMRVSEIPGVYNMYVSVSQDNAPDDFKPIRQHPTINVLPAKGDVSKHALQLKLHEATHAVVLLKPDQEQPRDAQLQVAQPDAKVDGLNEDLASQVEAGNLDAASTIVEFCEEAARQGKKAAAVTGLRDLKRALKGVDADAAHHSQAQALLKRLESLATP